jgi:hypothetical protein
MCIKQTAPVPHGYRATFRWSDTAGLTLEWEPEVPHIRKPRHLRRFGDA